MVQAWVGVELRESIGYSREDKCGPTHVGREQCFKSDNGGAMESVEWKRIQDAYVGVDYSYQFKNWRNHAH